MIGTIDTPKLGGGPSKQTSMLQNVTSDKAVVGTETDIKTTNEDKQSLSFTSQV